MMLLLKIAFRNILRNRRRSLMTGSAVAVGALALRHLWRTKHPVLDLSVFRIHTFRVSILGGSLFRAGGGTLVFLLPLLLQVVFGMSAMASGSITFATAVGSLSMKLTARPILRRYGFRMTMIVDTVISAASISLGCRGRLPKARCAPDRRLIELFPKRRRPHEGLVVETGNQDGREERA